MFMALCVYGAVVRSSSHGLYGSFVSVTRGGTGCFGVFPSGSNPTFAQVSVDKLTLERPLSVSRASEYLTPFVSTDLAPSSTETTAPVRFSQ